MQVPLHQLTDFFQVDHYPNELIKHLSDDSLTFTDFQALIEDWFHESRSQVHVLRTNELVNWLFDAPSDDLQHLADEFQSIDAVQLFNAESASWNYTHVVGLANIDTNNSCAILVVDLPQRTLTLHRVSLAGPHQEDEDVMDFIYTANMIDQLRHSFLCWLENKIPQDFPTEGFPINLPPIQYSPWPTSGALGLLLHSVGLLTEVDFNNCPANVTQSIGSAMPQAPVVTVTRRERLDVTMAFTVSKLADDTEFNIPDEVRAIATMFVHSRGKRRITALESLMTTLYFVHEPLVLAEAVKLSALLGLLPGIPANTELCSSRSPGPALLTKYIGYWNAAIVDANSNKMHDTARQVKKGDAKPDLTTKKRKFKHPTYVARRQQYRTQEGRLPRFYKEKITRAKPGTGKGAEWHLFALTEIGRNEAGATLGLLETSYAEEDCTLTNPKLLLMRMIDQSGGEISYTQLERLWQAEQAVNPLQVRNQHSLVYFIRGWTKRQWNSPALLASEFRGEERFFCLNRETRTMPGLEPLVELAPLNSFEHQLLELFRESLINQISELFLLLSLEKDQLSLAQLQTAVDHLVERELLHCLDKEAVAFVNRYYMFTTGSKPTFEEFYNALNSHYSTKEMMAKKMVYSRPLARTAYDSRTIASIKGLWSSHMIQDMSSTAVVVRHCHEMPHLGSGLFAGMDLGRGTRFPINGHVTVNAKEGGVFQPYTFAFVDTDGRRVEINTKPEDEVTCLAGFVNDPRDTGCSANAQQEVCQRENRLYLTLTRDVFAGEQIFWNYGDAYWAAFEEHSIKQQMPQLIEYEPADTCNFDLLQLGNEFHAGESFFYDAPSIFDIHPGLPIV